MNSNEFPARAHSCHLSVRHLINQPKLMRTSVTGDIRVISGSSTSRGPGQEHLAYIRWTSMAINVSAAAVSLAVLTSGCKLLFNEFLYMMFVNSN